MTRKNTSKMALRGIILLLVCATARLGVASSPPATLKAISVSVPPGANLLQLRIDGEYAFNAVQATPDTLFVDLVPATAENIATKGEWSGGLLTAYRVIQFSNSAKQPVVRLQVELKHHQEFQVQRTDTGLSFLFSDNNADATVPSAVSTPPAEVMPAPVEVAQPSAITEPPPVKSNGEFAEVSGVSIRPGTGGELYVDVATTQPTTYHVLQLSNPRRLVVDLDKAHQSLRQKTFPGQSPLLNDVRIGQFRDKNPAIVRVVADLAGDATFDVHAQAGGIRIELKPHVAVSRVIKPPAPVSVASVSPVKEASAPPNPVEVKASEPPAEATIKPTEMAKAEPVAPPKSVNKVEPVPASHSEFQNALPPSAGSSEVSAAPLPSPSEQAPESVQAAHAAKVMAGSTEASSQGSPAQNPETATEQTHFTGEPISLNLKDVDLKDFFRLIHEISGLNILVDPNVTGTVTMVLDNVPWDQALDIVLKNSQLGKTLEGNVLRISRLETLAAQQAADAKLVEAREDAQPLVTRFIPVNYANAKVIQTLLKGWVGGGALSRRGNILVDDRTNTLIVSDISSQIPIIEKIVQKLDTKTKQVSIEARVILTTQAFERDLSGALNQGWVNKSNSTVTGGTTGTGSSAQGNIPTASGAATRVTVAQTAAAGFGAYAISNEGARYFINAIIAASEQKSETKTISKPMIVTQNNVAGTVVQGVEIPIQTNINNTISVTYVNAALTLTVTPQVTQDGNVFLIIKVENSSPGTIVTGAGISINTQSANTQVLVPDGGTVIFGGVSITGTGNTATYVPWLGQIPLLGQLFKTSAKTSSDNELLFFVSPKVLPG